jgi:hypothetical protein
MKKWLFNPFVYVAGTRALLIGIAVMAVTAVIGVHSNAHFDGVIDMHAGRITPAQLIDWGLVVVLFYAAGLLFSRSSIRFIDVAGTMALARWPMIFCALLSFGIPPLGQVHTLDEVLKAITPTAIAIGLLGLVFTIWMIALMYNAFKVSCNMKGGEAIGTFIVALLIAEVLSHVMLHQLYNHFI